MGGTAGGGSGKNLVSSSTATAIEMLISGGHKRRVEIATDREMPARVDKICVNRREYTETVQETCGGKRIARLFLNFLNRHIAL